MNTEHMVIKRQMSNDIQMSQERLTDFRRTLVELRQTDRETDTGREHKLRYHSVAR